MNIESIERKIRDEILKEKFPEMADADMSHQSYQLDDTLEVMGGKLVRGIPETEAVESGAARHMFIYQKPPKSLIVITDDEGEVRRIFRSR